MTLRALAMVALLAMPVAAQVVRPGVPPPPRDVVAAGPSGSARIRGRIVDADGSPLRRAEVTLRADPNIRRVVTSDSEGRYELSELPAGRFTISVAKGGYVTLQYGQRYAFEPGRQISLAAAQSLTLADLALPRGGVISGRITDPFGTPVVDAEVRIERYQYDAQGQRRLNPVPAGTRTNDLGEFRAFGLMPGDYVVNATQRPILGAAGPGGPSQGLLLTYHPGTANVVEAQTVPVGVGQEVSVQFAMTRGRMSRISGSVVDSTGRPAAGAGMMLMTPSSNSIGGVGRGTGDVAADGSFSIANVPPGDHFIQVRPRPGTSGATAEVANVRVSVPSEDITGFRITTTVGTTVAGRVEWEGNAPRSGSAQTTALRVTASAADGRPVIIGVPVSGTADANGVVDQDNAFRIGGLIGAMRFALEGEPPQWTLKALMAGNTDITNTSIDASGLGADSTLRVILTDKVTDLSGSVRNVRGEIVAEYVVVVLPDEAVESAAAPRYTRLVRPDQSGMFRMRALPPGRYVAVAVDALEQGTEWDPAFQRIVRPAGRRFTLSEGQALTLDLTVTQ